MIGIPGSWHIDSDSVLEALHGGADGGLQLDHVHAAVQNLQKKNP